MDKKIEVNKNPDAEVLVEDPALAKKQKAGMIAGVVVIIVAGILSGYFLSGSKRSGPSGTNSTVNNEKAVGSTNTQIYPDSAEGTLEVGGIDGEGTHHLIRPGGDDKTVYLTSSVVDLDQFVGKEVKVWGETHTAQKAGWFMDVGRVEVK